jgi:hypothetical protein
MKMFGDEKSSQLKINRWVLFELRRFIGCCANRFWCSLITKFDIFSWLRGIFASIALGLIGDS